MRLHEPQRAVTPGQAAVIYDGQVVLVAAGFVAEKRSSRPNRWLKKSCSP